MAGPYQFRGERSYVAVPRDPDDCQRRAFHCSEVVISVRKDLNKIIELANEQAGSLLVPQEEQSLKECFRPRQATFIHQRTCLVRSLHFLESKSQGFGSQSEVESPQFVGKFQRLPCQYSYGGELDIVAAKPINPAQNFMEGAFA
jgi:hypothetical protein